LIHYSPAGKKERDEKKEKKKLPGRNYPLPKRDQCARRFRKEKRKKKGEGKRKKDDVRHRLAMSIVLKIKKKGGKEGKREREKKNTKSAINRECLFTILRYLETPEKRKGEKKERKGKGGGEGNAETAARG